MKTCSTCIYDVNGRCHRIPFIEDKDDDDPVYLTDAENYTASLIISDPERFGCLLHESKDSENA